MNLMEVPINGDFVRLCNVNVPLTRDQATAARADGARTVTLGVRPEDWEVVPSGQGMPVEAVVVEELGADAFLYGTADFGDTTRDVIVRVDARRPPAKGSVIHVAPREGHVHLFHATNGRRIT